ncbi:hypothetical protein K1T71_007996 [Dendrolimus kikuchii]|uniref:Uncharacterized protein n=1 Tax=Dendrolimus kikuchii TaxID=765133 RepID=A0ACC1CZV1_9NEOP|nr:hypothetical protein K1T71_007996 [Dendrolimus kikuchii]
MAAQDEVDVCESWEDMDEIGLDQKIRLNSDCAPVKFSKGCKVTVEESACIGSQCIMPEPAIRILKRPSSSASGSANGENRARPVKTFEQRKKEYEEARLRILGEARSPEDVIDDNLTRLQDKLQANNINDNSSKKNIHNNESNAKVKERKVLARLPPGATAVGLFPSPPPRGVLVIRTPRGPDGTKGFQKSERDKAVLRSIFDPTATIAEVADDGDTFAEDNDEPSTPEGTESAKLCAQGVKLAEEGNLEEALQILTKGVEIAPERAAAYNDRAQLLRLMQKDADAMKDIDRALQLTEGKLGRARALALCQRGVLLRKQGKDDDARTVFTEAAKLGSSFAKKQVVELNPYAALCNQMLSQVMRGEKEIKL